MATKKADAQTTPVHTVSPKLRLIGVIVLALILIGVAAWLRVIDRPTATQQQTQTSLEETVSKSDDEALEQLTAVYNDAATQEGKAEAAFYLASRYSEKDDQRSALRYYREADENWEGKNIDAILGVANTAEALKSNKLARDYYQKAIDYYRPQAENDPSLQDLVQQFETKMKDLE